MTEDTVLSLSLQKGIETKTDLKAGVNGRLLSLENAVFTGVTDIQKRNGYAPIPNAIISGGSIAAGNSSGVFNNDILMTFDGQNSYSYSPDKLSNVSTGLKIATEVSSMSLSSATEKYFFPSVCYGTQGTKLSISPPPQVALNGALPTNQNQFTATYFDSSNNAVLGTYLVTAGFSITSVKTGAVGANFGVLTGSAANAQITVFNQTTPATSTPTITLNSSTVPPDMDMSATNFFVVLYDGTNIQLYKYDSAFTLVTSAAITPTGVPLSLSLQYDSINNEILLGYTYTGHMVINRYNSTTLAFIANAVSVTDSGIIAFSGFGQGFNSTLAFNSNGTDIGYFYDQFYAISSTWVTSFITSAIVSNYRTTPVTQTTHTYGCNYRVYSKAFYKEGLFYCAMIFFGISQGEFSNPSAGTSTIESQTGIMVVGINYTTYTAPARIAYDQTYLYVQQSGYFNFPGNPLGVVQWSNLALPYLNAIQDTGSLTVLAPGGGSFLSVYPIVYNVCEADLTFDVKLRNLSLGKNLNITGGTPSIFDGAGIAEQGFNTFPEIGFLSTTTTGSDSYSYIVLYTWYDFQGNLHRSAPSIARSIGLASTIGVSNSVTVSFTSLGISEPYKANNVQIQIYRTALNAGIYYLIGSIANTPATPLQFVDTTPDVNIVGSEQLYTTGNEVDNIPPPSLSFITEFKNRQIGVNDQDRLQWWFSKQVIEGFPVEFSDLFTQNIDQKGGPITSMSTMDDKLIFFKASNVWYVFGDGPAPNGANNDFTYPQIVSSDTGCANQDSIILTPTGLLFQSPKGIYQLSRNLELSYIGAPVEKYNNIPVTSVQMIAGTTQVRFTLNSGIVLVYDYLVGQWSVFDNISAVDSVIYQGNFTYLDPSGVQHTETPGVYFDNTTTIPLNFRTGWIKLSDIQGFERFKKMLIIGSANGNSSLQVNFYFDYNASLAYSVSAIPVDFPLEQQRVQYRLFPSRQKCEAFQIEVIETPDTNSPGMYSISNMALEVGMKKGPYKLPAAQSFG